MGSTFNPQILVEKLAKLNSSQASIETLSHWCIFHMNKAKQVVETWARQFHCSPREQRLAFLYLANDILQNSRRKGSEFATEFWKVLPDALRDVVENGDEFGRNAAMRMIGIWEDRKVFVSRGPLKEEFLGRHQENHNKNEKPLGFRLKQPVGNTVDKIISGYQVIYGGQVDEDVILSKCRNAISYIQKVDKEIGSNIHPEQLHGPTFIEELQGQNATLRDCIERLKGVEASRANLVSHLREALQEQESKLAKVRSELQVARSETEHASTICQRLLNNGNAQSHPEKNSSLPPGFGVSEREKSAPVMYTRQIPIPENPQVYVEGEPHKSQAAAVAAKLTSSASSAQMLSYVLSSLASECVLGNQSNKDPTSDLPPEKRPKLENPQPQSEPLTTTNEELNPSEPPPPPPSSPPPPPPLPPMPQYQVPQYMPTAQFSYFAQQPPQPTLNPYPVGATMTGLSPFATPPANSYQGFQGQDGNFYTQPPMAPISRP